MTYDATPASRLAQKYFIQALRLAQAGNDRLLGASILNAMSHQATYTGRFREAANLARAARTGTCGLATATQTSHFYAMEARALARLGDAKACDHALAEARGNSSGAPRRLTRSGFSILMKPSLPPSSAIACVTSAAPRTPPNTRAAVSGLLTATRSCE
jgi:hypothetical protein